MRYRVGTSAGLAAIAIALVIAPSSCRPKQSTARDVHAEGRPDKIAEGARGVELAGRQTAIGIKADVVLTAVSARSCTPPA